MISRQRLWILTAGVVLAAVVLATVTYHLLNAFGGN